MSFSAPLLFKRSIKDNGLVNMCTLLSLYRIACHSSSEKCVADDHAVGRDQNFYMPQMHWIERQFHYRIQRRKCNISVTLILRKVRISKARSNTTSNRYKQDTDGRDREKEPEREEHIMLQHYLWFQLAICRQVTACSQNGYEKQVVRSLLLLSTFHLTDDE